MMTRWMCYLVVSGLLAFVLGGPTPALVAAQSAPAADLASIKSYLTTKAAQLRANTDALKRASTTYYALAAANQFDYQRLWAEQPDLVRATLRDARTAWTAASPLYEQIEGVHQLDVAQPVGEQVSAV